MTTVFCLERPGSVADAVRILAAHSPEAMVLAGGTDVIPNLQMRLFQPGVVVDLKPICELRGITWSERDGLRIGAMTTLTEICTSPLIRAKFAVLASAVGTIAGPLQRNMGTIGGNLCLETRCRWYNQSYFWRKSLGGCLKHPVPNEHAAHPDTICHVAPGGKFCWAVWSGDAAPALLTLDAEVEIAAAIGLRRVALRDFYRNDGMNRIALGRDELLTAVMIPARMAGRRGEYRKLRIRNSIDYPLAGVAVSLDLDRGGVCRDARVAVNAVNPAPLLIPEANDWLSGQRLTPELVERIAQRATQIGKPLTTSASTPVYRREMLKVFAKRALITAGSLQNGNQKMERASS
jgi:4-hydroxybenzoyl-CoA reductase subunit beta